ncbi:MAG: c-type cytochrome biogenesis protein CcmI, partial [Gammaproteobacteria bacterium]|nr:c-type cytochrome biogenesis protein CcmI [Gammaproteobacteria bacterium]
MTFWLLITLMIVVSLLIALRPLLSRNARQNNKDDQAHISVYRLRLDELAADEKNGVITSTQAECMRKELEQNFLQTIENQPVNDNATEEDTSSEPRWGTVTVIAVVIPLVAIGLYLLLGSPDAINPHKETPLAKVEQQHSVTEMIIQLEAKLEQEPTDVEGWNMLARSYMTLRDFEKAVMALQRLYELVGDETDVLIRYADALTMLHGGKLSGKPQELIEKALALEPEHPIGLWLGGMAFAEQGEYQAAIDYWNRLLPQLVNNETDLSKVKEMIAQAQKKLGYELGQELDQEMDQDPADDILIEEKVATGSTITVNVSLAADLLEETSPTDTLFIFAKAPSGPP